MGEILECRGFVIAGPVDPAFREKLLVTAECCAGQKFLAKPRGSNANSYFLDEEGNYLLEVGNFLSPNPDPPRAQGVRPPQELLNESLPAI
jgi:hypothetical protein